MLRKQATDPDVLISGLEYVEIMPGSLARFVIYFDKIDPETREVYRYYPPAIVMPIEAVPDAIMKATAACAYTLVGQVRKLLPHDLH